MARKGYLDLFGYEVSQPTAIIGGGILAVGTGLLLANLGKEDPSNKPPPSPLPTGGAGIPTVGTDPEGNPIPWSPTLLAEELFAAMNGPFGLQVKAEAFSKGNALTDDQLTALYNAYNDLYYDYEPWFMWEPYEQTLTEWIANEEVRGQAGNDLLSRLRSLGLD